MRSKAILVLSSVCLLGAAAVLTGTTKSASSDTGVAVPQPGWLAALQFKDLTLGAALP